MINLTNYISKLDSERFGFIVAKVDDFEIPPKQLINELKKNGCKLIISKVPLENYALINSLEDLGFRLKDTQQTFRFKLENYTQELEKVYIPEIKIVEYKPQHLDQILNITKQSFQNYGHYSSNKLLDEKKCLDIYCDWAYRSCTDTNVADKIFVALIENKIVGYLPFKVLNHNNDKYSISTLAAIDPNHRNKNIIRMLTVKGLQWGREENIKWEDHQLLTTNYPLSSSLIQLGFKIKKGIATLHIWL